MTTSTPAQRVRDLIAEHYVFPDVAARIAALLDAEAPGGDDPDQLAAELTAFVQSVNHDLHLRIRVRRSGALGSDADWEAHYALDAIRNAGGVESVSRLDPETGLLAIAPYTSPVHLAEPYVTAAFALLTGVRRLIIDLRGGLGGTPETVALICGYLLGNEPVHLQDIVDRAGIARQYWTSPAAGRLPDDAAIAVLTSARTFSGCEELAYNLRAQHRATVFGERTGGGAHPVEIFALTDILEAAIPVARSVNAVTGTNWERVGVVPDVECPATDALDRALTLLADRATVPA